MMLKYYILFVLIIKTAASTMIAGAGVKRREESAKYFQDDFSTPSTPKIGPKGMAYNKTTSCETFGEFARFNPHSVVGIRWFVFYYWNNPQPIKIFKFRIPTTNETKLMHTVMGQFMPKDFNWSSTLVLKKELLSNLTYLLEEKNDRGLYMEYEISPQLSFYKTIPEGITLEGQSIRIRQTGDNKYLGVMECKSRKADIMSHLEAVPRQKDLQYEASRFNIRCRKGKSYLYQGHEWMPIPEMNDLEFWSRHHLLLTIQ